MSFDDGGSEIFTARQDGMVRVEGSYDGDPAYIYDLAQGSYLLASIDVYDGVPDAATRMTYSYPMPPAEMPVIEAESRWSLDAVTASFDGVIPESQSYATGAERIETIGGCEYRAIDMIVAYDDAGESTDGLVYLPDLGFAFLGWFEDSERRSTYTPVQIEALP